MRNNEWNNTLKANLFPMTAVARTVELGASQLSIDCLQNSVMDRVIVAEWTFIHRC